jgi:hypothetical protein
VLERLRVQARMLIGASLTALMFVVRAIALVFMVPITLVVIVVMRGVAVRALRLLGPLYVRLGGKRRLRGGTFLALVWWRGERAMTVMGVVVLSILRMRGQHGSGRCGRLEIERANRRNESRD